MNASVHRDKLASFLFSKASLFFWLSVVLGASLPGCQAEKNLVVVIEGSEVSALDSDLLELIVETARRHKWSTVVVRATASSDGAEKMVEVRPIRSDFQRFGDGVTLVVKDGILDEEYLHR